MKRQQNLKLFDFNLYYYFINAGEIMVLSKNITEQEYKRVSQTYPQIYDTQLSRNLFNGEDKHQSFTSYRFLAFDFSCVDEDTKFKIIELVKEWFTQIEIMEQKGFTIFFYFNELDINIQMLLETINYDFSTNVKVFSSGKVLFRNKDAFPLLLNAYIEYSHKKAQYYTDIRRLIMDVSKQYHQALRKLKAPILGTIYEDEQLKNMILILFNNNLNVTKTADQVYMHRNTINNKLNSIYEETSLNLQVFHDAVAMYLLMFS